MNELPLGPLMVDVHGTSLGADEKLLLSQPAVGAVILFSRNFDSRTQVIELIKDIKSVRTPSLLVAVDQEGGRVQRFKEGFYTLPAVNRFGICYDDSPALALKLSRSAGALMAAELLQIGLDFSFAPVLDCANFESEVIGDRGFHSNPDTIVSLSSAFIAGMADAGMAATGKHFPGHGGVIDDSHHKLPLDCRSLHQLQHRDLIPFIKLAPHLCGIMTAHVRFPEVDENPATFSDYWLNQILRHQIGFNGVIFSDDLSMKGAQGVGDPLQRTLDAIDAGCDMALICDDPENAAWVVDNLEDSRRPNQQRLETMRGKANHPVMDTTALRDQLDQLA